MAWKVAKSSEQISIFFDFLVKTSKKCGFHVNFGHDDQQFPPKSIQISIFCINYI